METGNLSSSKGDDGVQIMGVLVKRSRIAYGAILIHCGMYEGRKISLPIVKNQQSLGARLAVMGA